MKYQILEEYSKEDIMELVNSYISQGWEPLGGVVLEYTITGPYFYQTIILKN